MQASIKNKVPRGFGLVYFIQPSELVGMYDEQGQDTYKVGMSNTNSLDRCKNGYKEGTLFFEISGVSNAKLVENKILSEFNKHFTLASGKEYFKGGTRQEMITVFRAVVDKARMPAKQRMAINTTLPESSPVLSEPNDSGLDNLFKKIDSFGFGQ